MKLGEFGLGVRSYPPPPNALRNRPPWIGLKLYIKWTQSTPIENFYTRDQLHQQNDTECHFLIHPLIFEALNWFQSLPKLNKIHIFFTYEFTLWVWCQNESKLFETILLSRGWKGASFNADNGRKLGSSGTTKALLRGVLYV